MVSLSSCKNKTIEFIIQPWWEDLHFLQSPALNDCGAKISTYSNNHRDLICSLFYSYFLCMDKSRNNQMILITFWLKPLRLNPVNFTLKFGLKRKKKSHSNLRQKKMVFGVTNHHHNLATVFYLNILYSWWIFVVVSHQIISKVFPFNNETKVSSRHSTMLNYYRAYTVMSQIQKNEEKTQTRNKTSKLQTQMLFFSSFLSFAFWALINMLLL